MKNQYFRRAWKNSAHAPSQVEVFVGSGEEWEFAAAIRAEFFGEVLNACVDQQRHERRVNELRDENFVGH